MDRLAQLGKLSEILNEVISVAQLLRSEARCTKPFNESRPSAYLLAHIATASERQFECTRASDLLPGHDSRLYVLSEGTLRMDLHRAHQAFSEVWRCLQNRLWNESGQRPIAAIL